MRITSTMSEIMLTIHNDVGSNDKEKGRMAAGIYNCKE